MADTTIEWTEFTWNPTTGCDRVSAGCDYCYALTLAKRLKGMGSAKYQTDGDPRTSGPGFGIATHKAALLAPLLRKKPTKIFVNSMSDLFHDGVPDEYIAKVFVVMALSPHHTYQVLTKRHARMRALLSSPRWRDLLSEADNWACELDLPYPTERFLAVRSWIYGTGDWSMPVDPLPHVWLGVSVENQQWADIRVRALLDTPAAMHWLSCEPLLGPVDLTAWLDPPLLCRESCLKTDVTGSRPDCSVACRQHAGTMATIGWVVTGGESGRDARPMHPKWARSLRDQCWAADVPFLFKQRGEWTWDQRGGDNYPEPSHYLNADGRVVDEGTALADGGNWLGIWRVGKRHAGRALDGVIHDAYPEAVRRG